MRGRRHRGCVVLADNLEWNPARARPRDVAEDILRPERKRQPASPSPRYSNSAPNHGQFRVWWPPRSLVWPIFDWKVSPSVLCVVRVSSQLSSWGGGMHLAA